MLRSCGYYHAVVYRGYCVYDGLLFIVQNARRLHALARKAEDVLPAGAVAPLVTVRYLVEKIADADAFVYREGRGVRHVIHGDYLHVVFFCKQVCHLADGFFYTAIGKVQRNYTHSFHVLSP